MPPPEAQDCRFFVIVHIRPADASAQSRGGDQGTLFACDVVQGYLRDCVLSFSFFLCVVFLLLFFRLNAPPPRGAVGDATFHSGHLSFLRLTHRHADGPWEVFGMTSPLY